MKIKKIKKQQYQQSLKKKENLIIMKKGDYSVHV